MLFRAGKRSSKGAIAGVRKASICDSISVMLSHVLGGSLPQNVLIVSCFCVLSHELSASCHCDFSSNILLHDIRYCIFAVHLQQQSTRVCRVGSLQGTPLLNGFCAHLLVEELADSFYSRSTFHSYEIQACSTQFVEEVVRLSCVKSQLDCWQCSFSFDRILTDSSPCIQSTSLLQKCLCGLSIAASRNGSAVWPALIAESGFT